MRSKTGFATVSGRLLIVLLSFVEFFGPKAWYIDNFVDFAQTENAIRSMIKPNPPLEPAAEKRGRLAAGR
jgi:hypothetical protein